MARTPRPTFTSLVYGLFDGGYRIVVSVNGVVRAAAHAADRVEGEMLARRIKRALKRQMRRASGAIPNAVASMTGAVHTVSGVAPIR